MKILAISHSALLEAYQEKYEFLANKFGHEVLLITQKERAEGGGRIVHGRDRQSGRLFVKTLPSFLKNSLRQHFYTGLTAYARGFRPDLVYTENEPQAASTWQALKAARKFKSKFVFFTWENIEQKYAGRKRSIEKKVLALADSGIAGNQDGFDILRKQKFSKPLAVIPQYGINPKDFYPRNDSVLRQQLKLEDKFVIGYVGRLLPEKNIASVVQALRQLPENCHLLLVGNGPERDTLLNLAKKLGLDSRVKFIKAVSYKDIPEYMNLFNVLVLASITTSAWKEQFGRVLPEAMACMTPVVGSDSGEIPNVIGDAGLIFPEGDVTKLTQALQKLLADKSFYNQIAKRGYKRTLELYTTEGIARQTNDFFVNLKSHEKKHRH